MEEGEESALPRLLAAGDLVNEVSGNCKKSKVARVEVNISLAFLHWVRITLHP